MSLRPVTDAEAAAIRHRMVPYIIAAMSLIPDAEIEAAQHEAAPSTPTRRAGRTPRTTTPTPALPVAEEAAL